MGEARKAATDNFVKAKEFDAESLGGRKTAFYSSFVRAANNYHNRALSGRGEDE